jgi:hypothetical protein
MTNESATHVREERIEKVISKGMMRFGFKEKEKHMEDKFRNPMHV